MPRSVSFPRVHLVVLCVFAVLAGACASADEGEASVAPVDRPGSSSSADAESSPSSSTSTGVSGTEDDGTVVTAVVDGDTIDVRVGRSEARVRIIGVNAPEDGECLAGDATRWLRDRIAGEPVTLVADRSDRDDFGRLLRYVEHDGTDVGAALVRSGLALARRYPPDTARADTLDAAQAEAEAAAVGMWAGSVCGPAATGADGLAFGRMRFDADGDDNANLNDEWVEVTNTGDAPVDLTGWMLKDESASNRFGFPAGFSLAGGATVTVRTGCGRDSVTDLHWCKRGSAVWNNGGDTAFLLDPAGNVVDAESG